MEILQNDEKLREEIINDAKTKAQRIISKAERESEEIKKSAENNLFAFAKEYDANINNIISDSIRLLNASVEIEVKKQITLFSGELINNIFEEIKKTIISDKKLNYKKVILKLIKMYAGMINDSSFIIETNEKELKRVSKKDLLNLKLKKGNVQDILLSNKNINGFILYSSDKKRASYISIENYIDSLKKEFRTNLFNMLTKGK